MNKTVTSEEEILAAARALLLEKGTGALTMRSVAAACGVAVGSIYNYFPSKGALVGTTIESVWTEIFRPFTAAPAYSSFADCAAALLAAWQMVMHVIQDSFRCMRCRLQLVKKSLAAP